VAGGLSVTAAVYIYPTPHGGRYLARRVNCDAIGRVNGPNAPTRYHMFG